MNSRGRQRQRLNWDGLRKSLTLRLNGCFTESSDSSQTLWHHKLCSICCSFVVWDPKVFIYWSLDHSPPHSGAFDQNVCAPWGIGLHSAPRISMKRCPNPSESHLKISSLHGQQRIYVGTKAVAFSFWFVARFKNVGETYTELYTYNVYIYIYTHKHTFPIFVENPSPGQQTNVWTL